MGKAGLVIFPSGYKYRLVPDSRSHCEANVSVYNAERGFTRFTDMAPILEKNGN